MSKPQLIDLIARSRKVFFYFVGHCNQSYRSGHDLAKYRQIITHHKKVKDIGKLVERDGFLALVYETLKAWNMDQRAAELTSFTHFSKSIRSLKAVLQRLYEHDLAGVDGAERLSILTDLEKVFKTVDVMRSQRKIVGVSKTLHFLLPDLVMPIDSKYTMQYYFGYNRYHKEPEKEFLDFKAILEKNRFLAHKLALKKSDARGGKWNTSITKLPDNATIGMNKVMEQQTAEDVLDIISGIDALDIAERKTYLPLLQKQKKAMSAERRARAHKELLLKKAKEQGITVTPEELEEELRRTK